MKVRVVMDYILTFEGMHEYLHIQNSSMNSERLSDHKQVSTHSLSD
jgi:hypothetical protein